MKRGIAIASIAPLLLLARDARPEDSVLLWGNYHKERSTRVFEPWLKISKDLPLDSTIDVTYMVDQVTSASGAFTATDEPFQEYRQEVRVGARIELFGFLTPGLTARYSYEPDYQSTRFGAELTAKLFEENTSIRTKLEFQDDDVGQRERPGFEDDLETWVVGVELTQALRKDLIAGLKAEAQILDGLQENLYRVETHPLERRRYCFGGWALYRSRATGSTLEAGYDFYIDSWDLSAHTVNLMVIQDLGPIVSVAPRFRWHSQSGVFFTTLTDGFSTNDPKLVAATSRLYELQVILSAGFLRSTALSFFDGSRITASYGYYDQGNAYGPAHLAGLGWYWPF